LARVSIALYQARLQSWGWGVHFPFEPALAGGTRWAKTEFFSSLFHPGNLAGREAAAGFSSHR